MPREGIYNIGHTREYIRTDIQWKTNKQAKPQASKTKESQKDKPWVKVQKDTQTVKGQRTNTKQTKGHTK